MRKQVLILLTQISHLLHTMDLTFSQILRTMITEKKISESKSEKYEKIGDYKVGDYVERPHEYKK